MIRAHHAATVALRLALPGAMAVAWTGPSAAAAARGAAIERQVPPGYPAWARGTGMATTVELRVQVGADGRPRRIVVEPYTVKQDIMTRPMRASFDSAAVACVHRWSFRSARRAGRPVAAWLHVGVTFEDPGDAAPDTLAKAPR